MLLFNNTRPFIFFSVLSLPLPILIGIRLLLNLNLINLLVFTVALVLLFIIYKLYYYDSGELYLKLKSIEFHDGYGVYSIPYHQVYLDVQTNFFGLLGYKVMFLCRETIDEPMNEENTFLLYTLVVHNQEQLQSLCRFLVGAYPNIVSQVDGIVIDASDEEIKRLHEKVLEYLDKINKNELSE